MTIHQTTIALLIILLFIPAYCLFGQQNIDSTAKARELLRDANVKAAQKEIEITVRSVDISKFPEIKIFVEAYNKLGDPLDSLNPENVFVYENGEQRKVLSVEKVPVTDEVTVDFVFIIDITGSMQKHINAVMRNISSFTSNLMKRGIDYRLGMILFTDDIEKTYQPTKSVVEFSSWLEGVIARGGGDEKENALEALEIAAKDINYRFGANRVAVVITDAPYHQEGEDGFGVTNMTTQKIINMLINADIRVFTIGPPRLESYAQISRKTRGNFFDIDYPFSTILDNFSQQLTNLYYVKFSSAEEVVPDSIEIAVFNEQIGKLIRKTIPIVELGRKLIIENLLFETNRAELPQMVKELDIVADFMKSKPNVTIIIEGHTDNIGSTAHNDFLSIKRAEGVKLYFANHGIDPKRIKTVGYGKRKPIASNKDEYGRSLNRRTEIVITGK